MSELNVITKLRMFAKGLFTNGNERSAEKLSKLIDELAIMELAAIDPQQEWISVATPPAHKQRVNFCVDSFGGINAHLHGLVLGGSYDADNECFSIPGTSFLATHWQPSPEPPRS
jgi:hypothetical protein